MKNRYSHQFRNKELLKGKSYMLKEIKTAPKKFQKQLMAVFCYYWKRFIKGEFTVDGATFIDQENGEFFNIWWFIHDGRNSEGYVGKAIDNEMLDIMILTDTPAKHFRQAIPYLKFTFLNIIRHFFLGDLKFKKPTNLIVLE